MTLAATTSALLHTLLDRAEQPGRQLVVRVRLSQRDHPAYFASQDSAPRRECNQQLADLASAGVIRLRWRKWEQGNWLEAVDLLPEGLEQLYALLQRQPRTQQQQSVQQQLEQVQTASSWLSAFRDWAAGQLAARHSIAPLKLDDRQHNADLLQALMAIADLAAPTLERTLSTRIFGSSKRLESLRATIVGVLRRHDPAALDFGDDDRALLRSHRLDWAPEYLALAGPLVVQLSSGATLDLGALQPSMSLSAATLPLLSALECSATRLVTVENATSFNELLLHRPPDWLVIYTGGFASPSLIDLLRRLRRARPSIVHQHWGDLDAGGLRILLHLRSQTGAVAPLAMDRATFEQHRELAQALATSDKRNLAQLALKPALHDCRDLIATLLAADQKLEQEAVPPQWVLAAGSA